MSKKSPAISKDLARINPNPEPIDEVLEPGPNPPTPEAIKRLMLKKITTNAERMINSLILLASNGHFQSAHYLLEEMDKLGTELKNEGGRSINEILSKIARHLASECNIEYPENADEAAAYSENETDAANESCAEHEVDAENEADAETKAAAEKKGAASQPDPTAESNAAAFSASPQRNTEPTARVEARSQQQPAPVR